MGFWEKRMHLQQTHPRIPSSRIDAHMVLAAILFHLLMWPLWLYGASAVSSQKLHLSGIADAAYLLIAAISSTLVFVILYVSFNVVQWLVDVDAVFGVICALVVLLALAAWW